MVIKKKILILFVFCFSLISCMIKPHTGVMKKNGLTVYPIIDSPQFSDASLSLIQPDFANMEVMPGMVTFKFDVKNFNLGMQTSDAAMKGIANSSQGQHIHFIVNDKPYTANYTNEYSSDLAEGHYVLLAFLSRSYHESIKNGKAYVLTQFNIGKDNMDETVDFTKPILFYSRPKGDYSGEEIKKLMLDFFLVNTDLSANGNRVRATINGTEFILTKWAAYIIEGLPVGKVNIKLELIDSHNKLIPGPYNSVERTVNLIK